MKHPLMILAVFAIIFVYPLQSFAEIQLKTREDVLNFLENAYLAQISLSEEERTMEEVNEVLDPYFTENYKNVFFDENVVASDDKFITYGTDFAKYYIPFFAFSNQTNIVIKEQEIYVIEFFPSNEEGPITYQDHYEGFLLTKQDGDWKIAEVLEDSHIPNELKKQAEEEKELAKTVSNSNKFLSNYNNPLMQVDICKTPFEAFFEYAVSLAQTKKSMYSFFTKTKDITL